MTSTPCLIEGQFGRENELEVGNFELCVAVGNAVQHWWRDNSNAAPTWQLSATFAHDVEAVLGLVQGSVGFDLELILLRTDHMLQHYWRQGANWLEGPVIGRA